MSTQGGQREWPEQAEAPVPPRRRVRSSTRRHVTLVRPEHAAVVLGVLGYPTDCWDMHVAATQLYPRAHAWLAAHVPHTVRDPAAAAPIGWAPDPVAAMSFAADRRAFCGTFAAFTTTNRPPDPNDWVSWESQYVITSAHIQPIPGPGASPAPRVGRLRTAR